MSQNGQIISMQSDIKALAHSMQLLNERFEIQNEALSELININLVKDKQIRRIENEISSLKSRLIWTNI